MLCSRSLSKLAAELGLEPGEKKLGLIIKQSSRQWQHDSGSSKVMSLGHIAHPASQGLNEGSRRKPGKKRVPGGKGPGSGLEWTEKSWACPFAVAVG